MLPFLPKKDSTVRLNVTSVSSNAALAVTQDCHNVLLTNAGSGICFARLTTGASTATSADLPILPNDRVLINVAPTVTYVNAVCPTSYTATLYATLGFGG